MNYELITEEEYNNLPDDDEQCFVRFESIVRASMNRLISNESNSNLDQMIQSQYMISVSTVGHECGIPNTQLPDYREENFYDAFKAFSIIVQGEVARIRVRGRGGRHPFSVQLAENTRPKIEYHLDRLRDAIEGADLSDIRKRALLAKLNDLQVEFGNKRVSFAKTMAILIAVSSCLSPIANTTTIAAEGKAAIQSIMSLLGADKESEEGAKLRLSPPLKALPAPVQKVFNTRSTTNDGEPPPGDDLDDEIPF